MGRRVLVWKYQRHPDEFSGNVFRPISVGFLSVNTDRFFCRGEFCREPLCFLVVSPPSGTSAGTDQAAPTSTPLSLPARSESPPLSPPTSPAQTETVPSPGLLEVLGRGQRVKKPSILLKNYLTNSATTKHPPHASHTATAQH